MNRLKIGVAGAGHLGRLHAKLLQQLETAELIGLYDIDSEKSQQAAEEFKCLAFKDMMDCLIRCQALIIAVPATEHADIALDAIYQNRHIFIEKPIAASVEEAREITESAETAGVKLQVGHIERFNPAFQAIKDFHIEPRFIEVHRLALFDPRGTDVAVVQDLMIHDLDLINLLVKSKVKDVQASGVDVVSGGVDIANARLTFESGCVVNITASRISAKKMRKMRIFQRDGYFSLDFDKGSAEIFKLSDGSEGPSAMVLGAIDKGVHKRNIVYIRPEAPPVNALLEEQKSFIDAVLNDKTPAVTGAEATAALELSEIVLNKIAETQW